MAEYCERRCPRQLMVDGHGIRSFQIPNAQREYSAGSYAPRPHRGAPTDNNRVEIEAIT